MKERVTLAKVPRESEEVRADGGNRANMAPEPRV